MKGFIGVATIVLLCLSQVKGIEDDAEDTVRRVFANLFRRGDVKERRGGPFDCNPKGDDCTGIVPCCGNLQCYWEDGYDALKEGVCVTCVKEGQKCQRDSQCCPHYQCNKGNSMWVDGSCEKYRREGTCYRDGQCVNNCNKKWYQTHGECE